MKSVFKMKKEIKIKYIKNNSLEHLNPKTKTKSVEAL
jgi:hypothetical protein